MVVLFGVVHFLDERLDVVLNVVDVPLHFTLASDELRLVVDNALVCSARDRD